MSAKTIQIFLPDGDPRGIRVAEITTRIVRAIEIPRTLLADFIQMPEATQVGLYFLFGQNADSDPEAYIGQTGTLGGRLRVHEQDRTFWNRAVIIVSTTNSLTQTHAQFLEWRAISEARAVGRYSLHNGNAGGKPYTPAPLEADCTEIYETARTLLATLGHPVFEPLITRQLVTNEATERQQQIFFCKGSGADGRGVFTDDGFVVLAGSSGRRESTPLNREVDQAYRDRLISEEVIRVQGDRIAFTKDHLVGSPSRAASTLMGRAANGWVEWKSDDGKTADELIRKTPLPSS
jgi:hypothetical protein